MTRTGYVPGQFKQRMLLWSGQLPPSLEPVSGLLDPNYLPEPSPSSAKTLSTQRSDPPCAKILALFAEEGNNLVVDRGIKPHRY